MTLVVLSSSIFPIKYEAENYGRNSWIAFSIAINGDCYILAFYYLIVKDLNSYSVF